MTARLTGDRDLDRVLRRLPEAAQGRALTAAVRKGAAVIRRDMKARTPVRSGLTRRAIRAQKEKGRARTDVNYLIGPDKSRSHIARFLEFGTRYMSARPFMRPAFDASGKDALREIGRALAGEITKQAKRLRGRR